MKLFDTSVVIEHIKRGMFEKGAISVITLIEILRGLFRS
jgi:predicted nucleic acid-binding protein